ncbi:MAG: hypothetical protein R3281_10040, partial [Balneolaceae bacterium]|nr:hypothetical protein [Balneolaceae bacterium]
MRCYTRVAIGLVLMMITGIQLVRAQDRLVGLWSVTEVEVGDDNMTPVARWTEIDSDGTYRSGNGWLQNAVGTWTYDTVHNTFLPKETSGVVDEFGPFLVKLATDTTKTWRRTEEGMEVIVHLQKIDDKPKSTA